MAQDARHANHRVVTPARCKLGGRKWNARAILAPGLRVLQDLDQPRLRLHQELAVEIVAIGVPDIRTSGIGVQARRCYNLVPVRANLQTRETGNLLLGGDRESGVFVPEMRTAAAAAGESAPCVLKAVLALDGI